MEMPPGWVRRMAYAKEHELKALGFLRDLASAIDDINLSNGDGEEETSIEIQRIKDALKRFKEWRC